MNETERDRLLKVRQQILDYPEEHDMDIWIGPCGTTHCIGGQLCLNAGWDPGDEFNVALEAAKLIGSNSSYIQDWLFYLESWPFYLRRRYELAVSCEERAQIAAKAIDCYIFQRMTPDATRVHADEAEAVLV
jgi:hypothetical protein